MNPRINYNPVKIAQQKFKPRILRTISPSQPNVAKIQLLQNIVVSTLLYSVRYVSHSNLNPSYLVAGSIDLHHLSPTNILPEMFLMIQKSIVDNNVVKMKVIVPDRNKVAKIRQVMNEPALKIKVSRHMVGCNELSRS